MDFVLDKGVVMHVTGACHCGQIRYEAEIDLAAVSICHCTDCQKITGSAFRVNVPVKPAFCECCARAIFHMQ